MKSSKNSQTSGIDKRIKSSGQNLVTIGCLVLLIGAVSVFTIKSSSAKVIFLIYIAASIFWIASGIRIQRHIKDQSQTLSIIHNAFVSTALITVASIVLAPPLGVPGLFIMALFPLILTINIWLVKNKAKNPKA
jgi:hypothetical protein